MSKGLSYVRRGALDHVDRTKEAVFMNELNGLFSKGTDPIDNLLEELETGTGPVAKVEVNDLVSNIRARLGKSGFVPDKDLKQCFRSLMSVLSGDDTKTYSKEYMVVMMLLVLLLMTKLTEEKAKLNQAILKIALG
jgi:hypothetical protein